MLNKFDIAYLKMAKIWSELSYSTRTKVGSLIVKDNMIISDGYNGTPTGFDNCAEDENGNTHWYVLHSEMNSLMKCAKNGISCNGATLYLTLSPCKECSKSILQSGLKRVVYIDNYRDLEGVEFLLKNGIEVEKADIEI